MSEKQSKSLHEKMIEVCSVLDAPKNKYNKFGKYHYRDAEGIVEAVKPLLHERGLGLVLTDDLVEIGGRHYIKATATVFDGKGVMSTTGFAREADSQKGMDSSQLTGSTSSYARKYALNGLFNIDDSKDSDATNTHGKDTPEKPEQKESNPEPLQGKGKEDLNPKHPKWTGAKNALAGNKVTIATIKGTYNLTAENEKLLTGSK